MPRVQYDVLLNEFKRILKDRGFSEEDALDAATVFADNSLDGIYSHGYMRFPRVVDYLDRGSIDPKAGVTCEMSFGAVERWNGNRGFGPLNARKAMARACELAHQYGIGLVALGNNNHWMRGGSYGWQAADDGCIAICWSNTMPNMPAWGGKDRKIGNNPIVFAVPGTGGRHVVVDCALSQFSYGKIEEARLSGRQLPVPGGYDEKGSLTTDPAAIERTWRVLPMGYWKGSGLSILLDLISTVLTNANSVREIGRFDDEVGLSQIMIAIDPIKFNNKETMDNMIKNLIEDIHTSVPVQEDGQVRVPGEKVQETRRENQKNGIPVNDEIWKTILSK